MNVGFTGTSKWSLTMAQRAKLTEVLQELSVKMGYPHLHHGDAVNADETAAYIGAKLYYCVVAHPPTKEKKRARSPHSHVVYSPAPYLKRNREIVAESDVLVACPSGYVEYTRSGTWATVRYARAKGIRIIIIFPDGSIKEEHA